MFLRTVHHFYFALFIQYPNNFCLRIKHFPSILRVVSQIKPWKGLIIKPAKTRPLRHLSCCSKVCRPKSTITSFFANSPRCNFCELLYKSEKCFDCRKWWHVWGAFLVFNHLNRLLDLVQLCLYRAFQNIAI